MNMQAIMKQAKALQDDMMREKAQIDKMEFESKNGFVTVKANGKKEILNITIDSDSMDKDDIEALEDMIQIAINNVFSNIDKTTEEKMGKYTNIPGLF